MGDGTLGDGTVDKGERVTGLMFDDIDSEETLLAVLNITLQREREGEIEYNST